MTIKKYISENLHETEFELNTFHNMLEMTFTDDSGGIHVCQLTIKDVEILIDDLHYNIVKIENQNHE